MTDFGSRLKAARKNKHITQKELAKLLHVKQSTISNYESNLRFPSADALVQISTQMQVSVDYLLGRSDRPETDLKPETSDEVSGSNLDKDSTKWLGTTDQIEEAAASLKHTFMTYLLQGKYQEATNLILGFQAQAVDTATVNLMFFSVFVFEPVLIEIGERWEAGELSVAKEHMISDMISRLMIKMEQDEHKRRASTKPYAAALMLTGAEEHEMPLRMIEAVFSHHGWTTYYLGRNLPVSSLEAFLKQNSVDVLGLSVTLSSHLNSCELLIRAIRAMKLPVCPKILVGGHAITSEAIALNQLGADLFFESQQALYDGLADLEKLFPSKCEADS